MAEIDQEVRPPATVGEERLVHLGLVEARHRAGIEAQRTRGHDQIGALQRAVAERGLARQRVVAGEPGCARRRAGTGGGSCS